MQYQNKRIVFYSFILVIGAGIYFIESIFKLPVPFFRFGFSHIITLFLIYKNVDFKDILFIIILKIIIGTLLSGTLFSVVFYLSLFSNIISAALQVLIYKLFNKFITIYSVSLFGAQINSLTQLFFLYFFVVNNIQILYLYKYIFWFSLVTGLLNAFITSKILKSEKFHIINT